MNKLRVGLRSIRERLGPLWWYAAIFFAASRLADVLNLYIGAFLLPRILPVSDLGAVDPVTRLAGFGGIPLAIVSTVGAKYLSTYHAKGEYGKIKQFVRDMSLVGAGSGMVLILALLIGYDALRTRLDLSSPALLPALCGLVALTACQPLLRMVLQGTQRFYTTMGLGLFETVLRLGFMLALVPFFRLSGYLFAVLMAGIVSLVVTAWSLRLLLGRTVARVSYYDDWRGIAGFTVPVTIMTLIGCLQGFVEPFVIKHFLPPLDSAGYYVACRFGYIPAYLTGAIGFVLFPLLSHRHESGKDTGRYLRQAMAVTGLVSLCAAVAMGMTADFIFSLRPQWSVYAAYAPFVWPIGLIVTLEGVTAIYVTHEIACRQFSFLWITLPVSALTVCVLYGTFGWAGLHGVMPETVWQWGNLAIPHTLAFAVWTMVAARAVQVLGLSLHWIWPERMKRQDVGR